MFSKILTQNSIETCSDKISLLKKALRDAEAVVIGAGAGLSTSAGLTYFGSRFSENFPDFIAKYHVSDMYSAGFYPYESLEEYWAYWSRHIYLNRYDQPQRSAYQNLLKLVQNKDYFVLTTNVDHCFQEAGFERLRLFYTQGDYGLWQCSRPCHQKTYDNEQVVRQMIAEQEAMRIPSALIPYCPLCGSPMTMNLRCDDRFVQADGWHAAAARYQTFLRRYDGRRILYLELGVGGNTPSIIKYPFWRMTKQNANAFYVCINLYDAAAPQEIQERSLCIQGDLSDIIVQIHSQ